MVKKISVIIPLFNEEKTIKDCLESLIKQSLRPWEIIIVDDGSTDGTEKEVLCFVQNDSSRQIATAPPRRGLAMTVKFFKQEHRGAGAARNLGVKYSKGDILVFIDGDMRFHPDFLNELTKLIREGRSRGTFSKQEFIANWNNIWARFWNYRRGLTEPRSVPEDYPSFSPVFRAILKSEFEKAGGFDERKGYNDDWSLSEKLGYKATETKAVFYHNNPESLFEAIKQARWEAKRKYKWGIWGIWGIWARGFRRLNTENSLLKTFGYLLFLVVVNTAGIIGGLEFYFLKKVEK